VWLSWKNGTCFLKHTVAQKSVSFGRKAGFINRTSWNVTDENNYATIIEGGVELGTSSTKVHRV
jgi:hypothetical protein